MAAGLVALLDDVAVLARAAAASLDDIGVAAGRAGAKAAGVIVDDAAVTPRYVQGLAAERELPIIRRIAIGSLRNKLLVIVPVALLLSEFLPVLLTPLLMLGGLYLCYEGAEKVWEKLGGGHHRAHPDTRSDTAEPVFLDEDVVVKGAVRTDFILSAEIMVISLNEVSEEPLLSRAVILVVVALGITALVYGAVAVIVKLDDVGLALAQRRSAAVARFGRGLVRAMPGLLAALGTIGVVAMLWVGGHILLVGVDELGLSAPYDAVKAMADAARDAAGGFARWLADTAASALLGLVVGMLAVAVLTLVAKARGGASAEAH